MKQDSQIRRISRLRQGLIPLVGAFVAFLILISAAILTA